MNFIHVTPRILYRSQLEQRITNTGDIKVDERVLDLLDNNVQENELIAVRDEGKIFLCILVYDSGTHNFVLRPLSPSLTDIGRSANSHIEAYHANEA